MPVKNWDDLRFVLAAHRHDSVMGAAEALKVDPSTVSRRLTQLERALDVELFTQLRGGVRFTEEGRRLAEAAESLEGVMHSLDIDLQTQEGLRGPLKVTRFVI